MKQAIVNFCKSMDTGLFLLDMPTGFGKTYSVLDFMVDNYDAPEFKDKKIFFVTTLKKNLPDKELREHFAKRGKADDYDKYCLRIEANADMVVEKLDDYRIAKEIREYIQAMIDSGNEDITSEWVEWARKKADWYDPSIATEDEYLGKRQHEKSAEEKEKSLQDSIRKSWYW